MYKSKDNFFLDKECIHSSSVLKCFKCHLAVKKRGKHLLLCNSLQYKYKTKQKTNIKGYRQHFQSET